MSDPYIPLQAPDRADSQGTQTAKGGKATKSLPRFRAYKLPFYGQVYRAWSRFIHKHGYHYAPKQYPPEPHEPRIGIDGKPITEWFHWCQWCGLRGKTISVNRGSES